MSELRQRHIPRPDLSASESESDASDASYSSSTTSSHPKHPTHDVEESNRISILDILRVLVTLVIASCGLSYYMTASESVLWGYRPWFTRWPVLVRYMKGSLNLTPSELTLYNGSDPSLPIYLAINGSIFDVSANPMVYGPGGSYNFFAGKDATRAYVTGCFQDDLTPDLTGVEEMFIPVDDETELAMLTPGQRKIRREQDFRIARARVVKVVGHWEGFYRRHKKYFQVGRVVREDGDVGDTGGKRELCESARLGRPKRADV